MGFRKKDKEYKKTICIKRSIEVNDELREWIFKNCNYRRKVWNDFVEEYYRCKDRNGEFNAMKYKKEYYNNIEVPMSVYDTYCTGISEQVMKDIIDGLKVCKAQHGKLRFHKFDKYRSSFKVHCKPTYKNSGLFCSRLHIFYEGFSFSERYKKLIHFKLKEPIFTNVIPVGDKYYYIYKDYAFSQEDIKEISFVHELGKFFIVLSVEVVNTYSRKYETHKRKPYAGIDLGIHNPVCISDKDKNYILGMSKRELSRIAYLERRVRRLQSILDRKKYMSKNYMKVLRKFRVSFYKMRNVRLNWRRNLSKKIACMYKNICVDRYRVPDERTQEKLPRSILKKMNYKSRLCGMYYFSECLTHACYHYKTMYINSPENTTIQCSKCDFINPKISLSQRKLRCNKCGLVIDRDVNASINCYNHLVDTLDTIIV